MIKYLENYYNWFFIVIALLIIIASFILIKPFITAILTAFVLTYIFYPLYKRTENIIKNKSIRSFILLTLITIVILSILLLIVNLLINESVTLYHSIRTVDIEKLSDSISNILGENIDLNLYYKEIANKGLNFILVSLSNFAFTIPQKAINLFVIFFIMYYLFKEGENIIIKLKENLPIKRDHSEAIIKKFSDVMYATIYGIIVTSIIQGILGTIGLFIFNVNSPIFFGLIMTIAAMFPYFGTSIVWVPASLIKLFNGDLFNGFGLLIYGILIIGLVDNIVRPKLISQKTRVHPIIILLGVLGGLKLFGFVGLILGPVLLSILVAIVQIYNYEIKKGG